MVSSQATNSHLLGLSIATVQLILCDFKAGLLRFAQSSNLGLDVDTNINKQRRKRCDGR